MARHEDKSKGKSKGDGDPKQSKTKRARIPRQSLPRTRRRKERRDKQHERQCKRKAGKLAKRIRHLQGLLGVEYDHLAHLSLGDQHKRLRRQARLAGLVKPFLKKRARKQKKVQPEKSPEEHATKQADELDAGKTA